MPVLITAPSPLHRWPSLSFGVLTIIMEQMLVDLSLFLVFFAVILLGFSGALLGLSETSTHRLSDEPTIELWSWLWGSKRDDPAVDPASLLVQSPAAGTTPLTPLTSDSIASILAASKASSAAALGRVLRGTGADDDADADGSLPLLAQPLWAMFTDLETERFSSIPFALPLMYVLMMVINVVLVNLLIAMFADTYARIKGNAEVEYHYQRFLPIFEHNHVISAIPPPFSLPLLLTKLIAEIGASLRRYLCHQDISLAELGVEKLHKLAAARPLNQRISRTPVSKKYVQRFLLHDRATGTDAAGTTPQALLKRVEAQLSALDERLGQQMGRVEGLLAPRPHGPTDADLRAAVATLHARLEREKPSGGSPDPSKPSRPRGLLWGNASGVGAQGNSAAANRASLDHV